MAERMKRSLLNHQIAEAYAKLQQEKRRVASSLKTIRDEELWRSTDTTFEDYVRINWGLSKSQLDELITLAEREVKA